jgi:hypothetical protein
MKRLIHLLYRLPRIPRRIAIECEMRARLNLLRIANRFSNSKITSPEGPIVSITSYGLRAQTAHLAIESIGRGQLRPSRLILWLDEESLLKDLPFGIRRLQKRGLEVIRCKNYGPHKKYYPYVESQAAFDLPLVTADDDVLYASNWLNGLVHAYHQSPNVVNCYRSRVVRVEGNTFDKYENWKLVGTTTASFRHMATGVGGVIYPPALLYALKAAGDAFNQCCPRGDDIWLHVQALRNGYKVRQVCKSSFRLLEIPGAQSIALRVQNMSGGENDRQIAATYTHEDIQILLSE